MMLVERNDETLSTKPIKTSYSMAAGAEMTHTQPCEEHPRTMVAGTSYVEMVDCVVPEENVIGEVGKGFYYAMANFNIERWGMVRSRILDPSPTPNPNLTPTCTGQVCSGNRMSRLMVEECFKWAMQRKIFGKRCLSASPTRRCRCVAAHRPSFCFVCWV